MEDFPDSNYKAPHFDFPWWEEQPGFYLPWLQPRLKESIGSETAHQGPPPPHASHTILVGPMVHLVPLHHLPDDHQDVSYSKDKMASRVQKLGF